jgi:hypothetical protein
LCRSKNDAKILAACVANGIVIHRDKAARRP